MAAVTLDDAVLTEIQREAASMKPGRTARAAVGWVLFQLGFLAGLLMTKVIWGTFTFTVASVKTGYRQASGPSKRDIIARQATLIAEQKMQLSRVFGPS